MERTQLHKKVYITRLQPNQLWLNSPLTVVGSNPGNYPWLLYLKALMRGQRNDFQQKNDWQLFILWENHGSLKSVMSESTNRIKIPAKWDILSLYPTGKMFYEIMFQHIRMEYAIQNYRRLIQCPAIGSSKWKLNTFLEVLWLPKREGMLTAIFIFWGICEYTRSRVYIVYIGRVGRDPSQVSWPELQLLAGRTAPPTSLTHDLRKRTQDVRLCPWGCSWDQAERECAFQGE